MLKETIEMAIKMGMEKFMISHFSYHGRAFEVSKEEIFDFIEGYENAIPMSCYFGTVYSYQGKYFNPTLCQIIYRLKDEDIPQ
jgi:hypothetical protein